MMFASRSRRAYALAAMLVVGGCGASDDGSTAIDDGEELLPEPAASEADAEDDVDDTVGEIGDEHDAITASSDPEAIAPADHVPLASSGQVVYVNFRGPTIKNCASCSDAVTNRSFAMGHFGKSAMNFAPFTDGRRRGAVIRKLRSIFARWKVTFTTKRPAAAPYTMLVISPSWLPHHGVAPLDCGNANPNDIAFVYRIGNASADLIARYAAHELGHSFGLAHVVGRGQVMSWDSNGRAFSASAYDTAHPSGKCFSGNVQYAGALLDANVGRR